MSPEVQAFATGFPIALMHAGATLLILILGLSLYALLSPHREVPQIRHGNAAAMVSFAGVVVGLAIPLAMSLSASTSIVEIGLWGVLIVFVQLLAFRLIDMVMRLSARVAEGEVAAAVLLSGAKLASALILAAAVAG